MARKSPLNGLSPGVLWLIPTIDRNWNAVTFNMTSCHPVVNPDPPIKDWGCLHGCHNNDAVPVCQGVPGL